MTEPSGTVHISPAVLRTIAEMSARAVSGVVAMRGDSGGGVRIRLPRSGRGVRLRLQDGEVRLDLYVILDVGADMLAVGREIQQRVAEAITAIVGLAVREVSVHVHDVR